MGIAKPFFSGPAGVSCAAYSVKSASAAFCFGFLPLGPRTSHTCNLHSLDKTRVQQVRTTAKVGEIALGICGDGTILQVLLNVLALVLLTICLELSERISLSNLLANHRLVLLGELHHLSLDLSEIIL